VDVPAALEFLSSPDEAKAREALGHLSAHARRYLRVSLHERVQPEESVEDVIQETLIRIWKARSGFRNLGVPAWFRFLKVTALRCWADTIRARPAETDLDPLDGSEIVSNTEADDIDLLLDAIYAGQDTTFFFHAATVLFCGLDPALSSPEHRRQLLAAQLYYLESASLDQLLRLLPSPPGDSRPSPEDLADWLSHPGVLRYLAFAELFLSNEEVAAHILGNDQDPMLDESSISCPHKDQPRHPHPAVADGPSSSPRWPPEEGRVLWWRYRYGMTVDEIMLRRDCPVGPEEVRELCDRSAAFLPFGCMMERLLGYFRQRAGMSPEEAYSTADLWQRLAFQYRYHESLPHADIRERTQPAAILVGYTVKLENLNMWLSGRRLLTRLARFCEDHCFPGAYSQEFQ
jgi:hypothetical protein